MTDNPFNDQQDKLTDGSDYSAFYLGYPDDEKFFAELIRDNWSLTGPSEADAHPPIYYPLDNSTRAGGTGGSIYIYTTSMQQPNIASIDCQSAKHTKTIAFDVQNGAYRDRNYVWVREVVRILNSVRRAGRAKLDGWDYLEVTGVSPRNNYINYYQTVIDVRLTRTVTDFADDGFGN